MTSGQHDSVASRGNGLTDPCRVVDNNKVVTDGPFMETKEIVGGFSIVQANSIDDAAKLVKDHPHFKSPGGASIEVLEFAPMPGM